jgi:hypothetical protein
MDLTFNIGHAITILSFLVVAYGSYLKLIGKSIELDKRVTTLEAKVESLEIVKQDIAEIKADLRWIRDILGNRNNGPSKKK